MKNKLEHFPAPRLRGSRLERWRVTERLAALPAVLWLVVLVLGPTLALGAFAFLSHSESGPGSLPLTLNNFSRLAGFGLLGFDPFGYPAILARSLVIAGLTTVLCVVIGSPMAFALARLPKKWRQIGIIAVVVPFWTNLLIRTYGWQLLLGPEIYPGNVAVLIGLTADYLPFFILPVYISVERLDWHQVDAARDLGASYVSTMRHAVIPQIRHGIAAGIGFVLVPAVGQFLISDLLGGGKSALIGNVIDQQFRQSRDWPFGSALAVVVLLIVIAALRVESSLKDGRGGVAAEGAT